MGDIDERGVRLSLPLIWTIGGGLVATGLYLGTSMATLAVESREFRQSIKEQREWQASIDVRTRAVEGTASRNSDRFDTLQQSIQELKAGQILTLDILRGLDRR